MQWQRAKPWTPGTEQPRGLVWAVFCDGSAPAEGDAAGIDWDCVRAYRLPATPEGRREADRIRKANARATAGADESSLVLPLPQGTRDALNRVCERAGYADRRAFMAQVLKLLERLAPAEDESPEGALLLFLTGADDPEVLAYRRLPAPFKRSRRWSAGKERTEVLDWLIARDGPYCAYCGVLPKITHIDHVVPVAMGGDNLPSNLVISCPGCNNRKGCSSLDEWLIRLQHAGDTARVNTICLFLLRRAGLIPEGA